MNDRNTCEYRNHFFPLCCYSSQALQIAGSISVPHPSIMTFDITIPVLNEEKTLEKQVMLLHDFLCDHYTDRDQWRIVIADNGSTDNSAHIAAALSDQYPEIQLVKVPEKGVGLALKTSWGQSKAEMVGYMDLDMATDLQHFKQAYNAIATEGYDLVYGSRLHRQSKVYGRTIVREITSRVFNQIVRIYLGVRFSDGMCGFKWLRRSHLEKLQAGGAVSNGWFFSTELLAVAEWQKLQLYELPVKWTDDVSSSRVEIIPLAKRYINDMLALKSLSKNYTHGQKMPF